MELDNFKFNLSRLKKCDQYWEDMNHIAGGRLCKKCDKKIVDFSNMSFTDIAFFMSESKEPVCGFYLPEQLEQTKPIKSKLPIAIGLTTLLTTSTVLKAETSYVHTEQVTTEKKVVQRTNFDSLTDKRIDKVDTAYLVGSIQYFDTATKAFVPVSYATIIIKNSRNGVLTKDDGSFKLRYLPTDDSTKIFLVISSVGLETKEIEVLYTKQSQLELGIITLDKYKGEITEFWVGTKKRSKLSRLWHKITKPFRR